MRQLLLSAFLNLCSCVAFAQSNNFDVNTWQTNGTVNAIVSDGSTVYLGGAFTQVGPGQPFGVTIDASTGLPNTAYAKPEGVVRAVVADGSGGWYIGGDFTVVGGVTRNYLARINSDGTLNDWNPNMGNTVYSLALSGGVLYVGGNFTTVGGVTRNRIAAFNASTGSLTDWNPNATSGYVYALAVNGSTVYAGGSFTTIGGQSRNRLAALDATVNTSNATSWNPSMNQIVYALAIGGGVLYAGGAFTSVAGPTTRNRIAAYDLATGALTDWNPGAGATVNALAVSGTTVYVGGAFVSIGGASRSMIAALDATSTTTYATSWNPGANATVNSLMVVGSTVYAGGVFTSIGGQARNCIVALDATGSATSWNPKVGNTVRALAENSGAIYAGGDFTIIGGELRNRLAAIDATTGQANAWNPNANNTVNALLLSGGVLYAGGSFTTVGGSTRNRIAKIDPVTAAVSTWDPNASSDVVSLAASGDTIYAGGNFTTIGGQTRNRLAALSASTGLATSFNANVSDKVNAIAVSGGKVYFGGQFTGANAVNGSTTRNYLAAVSTADGTVTTWDPNTNGQVFAVSVYNGLVYVAGDCMTFTPPGSTTITRNQLAALHPITAIPTAWNPSPASTVSTMAFSGSMVYIGRGFTSVGGSTRKNAAGVYLNLNTNNATPWYPTPETFVFSIAVGSNKVFIGGSFSKVDGVPRTNFASYTIPTVSWGGSAGGNFSDAANWAPGIAPSTNMDVSIPQGSPVMDVDHTISSGQTMTISGTGTLTIAAGKTLIIAGTADFGGKSVTFKSDASGTARLGQVTGTLSNATNVSIERYLPSGRKWRLLTAPLTGSTNNSIFYNWQNNDAVSAGTGVEIWGPTGDANPSSANSGMAVGGSVSIRSYDNGWSNVTNTNSTTLFNATTNQGFALFATGQYNNGASVISTGTAAQNTTLTATGTLITGDHTKSFTATAANQYFLVGNPYASPVDPRSFTASGTVNRTNLNGKLWMWDAKPGVGTGNGLGRYVSFDLSINEYSFTGNGYPDHNVMIQSGQAFFVQSTASGAATLVFRESSKDANGAHAMMGDEIRTPKAKLRLTLQQPIGADSTENLDGAVAVFHADGKSGLDPLDGSKLMNSSENIFFRREDRSLTFEHHPIPTATDTLFIRMGNLKAGATYNLQTVAAEFADADAASALLVDRFTGQQMPVSLKGLVDHSFTVTSDSLSTGDRFMVVFSRKASPVTVTPEDVVSAGQLKLYPNPVRRHLRLFMDVSDAGPYTVRIFDAAGVQVWMRSGISADKQEMEINTSALRSGVYRLVLTDATGVRRIRSFVKE